MNPTRALILAFSTFLTATAFGAGSKPEPVTAILLEPRQTAMRVAFDLEAQYPVVLVSFQEQANASEPYLHVWDGESWMKLSYGAFTNASFMRITPHRVVVAADRRVGG